MGLGHDSSGGESATAKACGNNGSWRPQLTRVGDGKGQWKEWELATTVEASWRRQRRVDRMGVGVNSGGELATAKAGDLPTAKASWRRRHGRVGETEKWQENVVGEAEQKWDTLSQAKMIELFLKRLAVRGLVDHDNPIVWRVLKSTTRARRVGTHTQAQE